jgi:hypothetical protein
MREYCTSGSVRGAARKGSSYRAGTCCSHHTDAERECAYDRKSSIGRLDKGLDEAHAKGWTAVDMKQDWKVIYPPAKR